MLDLNEQLRIAQRNLQAAQQTAQDRAAQQAAQQNEVAAAAAEAERLQRLQAATALDEQIAIARKLRTELDDLDKALIALVMKRDVDGAYDLVFPRSQKVQALTVQRQRIGLMMEPMRNLVWVTSLQQERERISAIQSGPNAHFAKHERAEDTATGLFNERMAAIEYRIPTIPNLDDVLARHVKAATNAVERQFRAGIVYAIIGKLF